MKQNIKIKLEEVVPTFSFLLRDDLLDLNQNFIPTQSEPFAVGYDVYAAPIDHKDIVMNPFQQLKIPTGIRVIAPEDYWLELRPRSSSFGKKYLQSLYGVIDPHYEGEMLFACQYIPPNPTTTTDSLIIKFGEPIAQLVVHKRNTMVVKQISPEEFKSLSDSRVNSRKNKGFGENTGK